MKNGRTLFFAFAVFGFWFFAFARANAETTACSYMYYNQSPRMMGMGGIDDVFEDFASASANPALLAFSPGGKLSLGGGSDAMEAETSRIDAAFRLKKTGLAIGVFTYEQSFDIINYDGSSNSGFSHNGDIVSFSAGYPVAKNLSAGFGMRNVQERFWVGDPDSHEDSTSYADMGLFYKRNRFRAAMRLKNFGEAKIWGGEELPSYSGFSAGYAGDKLKAGISVGGDQLTGILRLGAEYMANDWLALRMGVESFDDTDGMPSFGFTVSYGAFAFDFAAMNQSVPGNRVVTALRYNWGGEKAGRPRADKEKKAKPGKAKKAEPAKKVEPVSLPVVPEGGAVNIAVTDFEARAPLSQSEAAFISDFVRSDFVKSGRFNVIEKNNMDKVLAEQGFQQTGCSSAECAVAIGKVLNVKMMTVGSCGQLLGKYIITMNIVDVESAKIIFSDDVSVADPDELRDKITELIGNFLKTAQ
ncbi:MAG: CsgG/HfaB family protein [Elusimicrobiota bacterium]|nr:CsgG/HfaB family protein [Elusimicrobiota bacterium]